MLALIVRLSCAWDRSRLCAQSPLPSPLSRYLIPSTQQTARCGTWDVRIDERLQQGLGHGLGASDASYFKAILEFYLRASIFLNQLLHYI